MIKYAMEGGQKTSPLHFSILNITSEKFASGSHIEGGK